MKGADRGRVTDSVLVKRFSAFLYEEGRTRTTKKKKTTALLINTAEKRSLHILSDHLEITSPGVVRNTKRT